LRKAKNLPQYYTAREVSNAFTNLLTAFVKCDEEEAGVYAKLMAAVADGKVIALGIVDDQIVYGLPGNACWKGRETQ
jgi:hypothetical protein